MIEDDVVAGGQVFDKLCPYGVHDGPLALEVLVLGIIDAVPAVLTVDFLVDGQADQASLGEGLGEDGFTGAGDTDQ